METKEISEGVLSEKEVAPLVQDLPVEIEDEIIPQEIS